MRGKAVQSGNAHIRNQSAASAPEAKSAIGFCRYGNIGRSGRDDQNVSLLRPGGAEFQRRRMRSVRQALRQQKKVGHGPVMPLRKGLAQELSLLRADAGGQNRTAVLMQAGNGANQGGVALALGEDHFAEAGTHGPLGIQSKAAQAVLKGGLGKLAGGQRRAERSVGDGGKKIFKMLLFHGDFVRKYRWNVTPGRACRIAKYGVTRYISLVMSTRRLLFLAPAQAITAIFPPLRDAGFELGIAENLKGASVFIRKSGPDVIFARPSLPGFKVEDLLAVGADDPQFPPVIVITDKGSPQEAERLMHLGARDYWLEPLDVERIQAVLRVPQRSAPVPATSTLGGHKAQYADQGGGPRIVGHNPAIARVLKLARQVAGSRATVLISGESGTGKEMFARYLHAMSKRARGPFVAVNCAALPEHLLESELFGHEKGAFTGAISRKLGKFELADGGTILLDEISEMELALQAKLLRVLQENEIDRVGGTETVHVDVRVLATTNRNLEDWVKQGKFRQDLYFRLNVIPLRLPSLRERGDDVLELARFFMEMYVREYQLPPSSLSEAAIDWLSTYDFPGNVRELQNLMERAVLLANGRPIEPCHFLLEEDSWPLFEETGETDGQPDVAADVPSAGEAPRETADVASPPAAAVPAVGAGQAAGNAFSGSVIPLHEMERLMIIKGLEATAGNRTQAAELLGISVRTLRNKLNEYRAAGHPID